MSDLRELIISKSVEIIAESGIRGLSFREVARRAKVSHQAPYHYFKSDSEIISAIAKEGFKKLREAILDASSKHPTQPIDALNSAGIAYVQFALNHQGHFRVMFQRTLLPNEVLIGSLDEAKEAYQALNDLVTRAMKLLQDNTLGVEGITMLCWSTAHGLATLLSEGMGGIGNDEKLQTELAARVLEALGGFLSPKGGRFSQ